MGASIRKDNIEIVLVEPQNPGNVGAAARALYNMGLEHLGLVGWNEDVESRLTAYEWAMDGEWILQRARRCDSLGEAIAHCGIAVATTAREGTDRPPVIGPERLVALLEQWTPNNRVAVVFGPERTGLRREHLRLCSHSLILPTAPGRTSLNLAQAVLLVGYEILRATGGAREIKDRRPPELGHTATRAERQQLYGHARQALEAVGFLRPGRPLRPLDEICYLLDRAAATSHEVRILHGICRKILNAVSERERKGNTKGD